jgi:hypothetical protein
MACGFFKRENACFTHLQIRYLTWYEPAALASIDKLQPTFNHSDRARFLMWNIQENVPSPLVENWTFAQEMQSVASAAYRQCRCFL